MSVSGIGGGSGDALHRQMLKRTQREETPSRAYGGDDKPEMTKTTRKKDDDEKTPKELMEEMLERIEEKRQDEKLAAERAAEKASAEELTVTGRIIDTVA